MKNFDIISFLNKFCGIYNESLSFDTITHDDIKVLFPFLRTCPYEKVKNEDLYRGEIIGVYDKKSKIVYYYNPHIYNENEMVKKENIEENKTLDILDANDLSKEELLKLRRKYRLLGLKEEVDKLTKLIHKKKQEEPKMYREKREKLKKESYYD